MKSFDGDTPTVPVPETALAGTPRTASAAGADLLTAARRLHAAGLRVIPVKADESKAPALRRWPEHRTTEADLDRWFGGPSPRYVALGMVCGPEAGNVEMLEVEGPHTALCAPIYAHAQRTGNAHLLHRLDGWSERSPSGGIHWFYRVEGQDVPGSVQLARAKTGKVMVETRGARGMAVMAPSAGAAHPSGRGWTAGTGGPETMPTLTVAERDALHALFRAQDRHTPADALPTPKRPPQPPTGPPSGAIRAGDDYTARTTWAEVLEPHGWTLHSAAGDLLHWTRPGKETAAGPSATTGRTPEDRLYVFSTNAAPFRERTPYSRFAAYALLNHGGDYTAAARELARHGYGRPPHGGR